MASANAWRRALLLTPAVQHDTALYVVRVAVVDVTRLPGASAQFYARRLTRHAARQRRAMMSSSSFAEMSLHPNVCPSMPIDLKRPSTICPTPAHHPDARLSFRLFYLVARLLFIMRWYSVYHLLVF